MKTKTKTQLLATIQKYDPLEIELHEVLKKNSTSSKKKALEQFAKCASEYVSEHRDVVLIAIKLK